MRTLRITVRQAAEKARSIREPAGEAHYAQADPPPNRGISAGKRLFRGTSAAFVGALYVVGGAGCAPNPDVLLSAESAWRDEIPECCTRTKRCHVCRRSKNATTDSSQSAAGSPCRDDSAITLITTEKRNAFARRLARFEVVPVPSRHSQRCAHVQLTFHCR